MINSPKQNLRTVIVVGLSGSGRTTALNAFEDYGYQRIDNLPHNFVKKFVSDLSHEIDQPTAIGIAPRDSVEAAAFYETITSLRKSNTDISILFLTADDEVLLRRYSETRRRHPSQSDDSLRRSISDERNILLDIQMMADGSINTTELSPHQLKTEIGRRFDIASGLPLTITCQSFSYKHGVPSDADYVFDCRFLQNPHWVEELREYNGTDVRVQKYIECDSNFEPFRRNLIQLTEMVIPALTDSGRSYLNLSFGCTGGRHRSVFMTEVMNAYLAEKDHETTVTHRELKRLGELENQDA